MGLIVYPAPVAGTAAPISTVKYVNTASQSVAANTDVYLAYDTTDPDPTLVVKTTQGTGHQFTLKRAGVWAITAGLRFSSTGEVFMVLNSMVGTTGTAIISNSAPAGSFPSRSVAVTERFAADTVVAVTLYAASTVTTTPGTAGSNVTLRFAYLGS